MEGAAESVRRVHEEAMRRACTRFHWLFMGTAIGYRRSLFQMHGTGCREIAEINFGNRPNTSMGSSQTNKYSLIKEI
jgi:hypothetical protein